MARSTLQLVMWASRQTAVRQNLMCGKSVLLQPTYLDVYCFNPGYLGLSTGQQVQGISGFPLHGQGTVAVNCAWNVRAVTVPRADALMMSH